MEPLSCSACGLWISAKDDRCPHCNQPNLSAENFRHHLPEYIFTEFIMCVLLIMALSHFEPRNPPTKWIISDSFPRHDRGAPLPAITLLNDPPWPLAPFPNEAELEAKKFAPHPQK